jgi:hypothetical protein
MRSRVELFEHGCAKPGKGVASMKQLTPWAGLQPRARKPPMRECAEARSSGQMIETRGASR